MMKTIEEYANVGKSHDVMAALALLTHAYIEQCGLSIGYRTVIYTAAEEWQERLAWLDLPLSERAREDCLVDLMPLITEDYDPEIYDEYDIAGMGDAELQDCCSQMVAEHEFDEDTLGVLCWGIHHYLTRPEFISRVVETVAPDGEILKGVVTKQERADTSITMTEPFPDFSIHVPELRRDPVPLLIRGYNDYKALLGKEREIREAYVQYRSALQQSFDAGESKWKKMNVFDSVYDEIIGPTTVLCPERVISDIWGLEFYDVLRDSVPSWLKL